MLALIAESALFGLASSGIHCVCQRHTLYSHNIEMERGWHCGVNSPYQDGYWPEKVGQKFIIAGRLEQKGPYTFEFANAVYPHSEDLTFMQKVYAAANKPMKKGA